MPNQRRVTQSADGSITVKDNLGVNPDGSPAMRQWDISSVKRGDQIEKFRETFNQPDAALPAGERSAARDAIDAALGQIRS